MARRGRDLTVGVMFALALVIVALTIMAVGGESSLFVQKANYVVRFPNVTGLVVGSPVKMAGVHVGTVSSIQLSTDPEQAGIEVVVGIDRSYAERVRADSAAALRILQLLSGEKFVEIFPGSPESPELANGSIIEPHADTEILQQAAVAAENINDITVSLKKILAALESGEGLMGQMINDPEFGKAGVEALGGTLENLQLLSQDLMQSRSDGQGMLGRLLYDRSFADKLDDVGAAVERLSGILAAVDPDQGALGALLQKDGSGEQAVDDLRAAAGSLRAVGERLQAPEGLVGRLLNDPEYSEELAGNLQTTLANLAEISGKINNGEGTLGALINDPALHEGLEEIVGGANDSKFARWLLRHYRKKGIKAEDDEP